MAQISRFGNMPPKKLKIQTNGSNACKAYDFLSLQQSKSKIASNFKQQPKNPCAG